MTKGPSTEPLDVWIDCYEMKPKRRIKKEQAKDEIQRAWSLWNEDKDGREAMFAFFGWLQRYRPYFLTFAHRGDRWQIVRSWLTQVE